MMLVHKVRSTIVPVLAAGLLVAAGCSSGKEKKKKKKKKKKRPPAHVDLPEPPPESAFEIPEKNADGSFRVRGLIAHKGKHLGKKRKIKGYLSFISPECDPEKAKKKGKKCPEPYMYIKDSKDGDAKMMVVGFKREFLERSELEPKKTYVFKGTYKKIAHGFVASEDGLLLVDKIGEHKVVEEEDE